MKSLFPNRALVAAIVVSFTLSVFAVSSAQSSKRSSVNVHLVTGESADRREDTGDSFFFLRWSRRVVHSRLEDVGSN
jgi:hypothetical protein